MQRKTISTGGLFSKTEKVEFDESHIFVSKKKSQTTLAIDLKDIHVFRRTGTRVNNQYYWELQYSLNGDIDSVTFRSNETLWNRSFSEFKQHLEAVNPSCVKPWTDWWQSKFSRKWLIIIVLGFFIAPITASLLLSKTSQDKTHFPSVDQIDSDQASRQTTSAREKEQQSIDDILELARQGDHKAQSTLGYFYHTGQNVVQDYAEAEKWWLASAEQGNVSSQHNLGIMYRDGTGLPIDNERAMFWLEKAARQGFPSSQYSLGVMYANGKGGQYKTEQAAAWYEKAAMQGHVNAQFNLGTLYLGGGEIPLDLELCFIWFSIASKSGDEEAKTYRDSCADNLSPSSLSGAQNKASTLASEIDEKLQ